MAVSNCSICSFPLDGTTFNVHPGDATISHIFHQMCIQSWMIIHPGDCPICHRHIVVEPLEDPLIRASRLGNLETVRRLNHNLHIATRGRGVVAAVRNRHESIVRELLQNASIWDSHRIEAMIVAIQHRDLSMLDLLLQNVRSFSTRDWDTLIEIAVSYSLEVVDRILQHGAISIESRGRAVHMASCQGDLAMVQRLLRDGTISRDNRGLSVVDAARQNHSTVVQELLANFAVIFPYHRGEAVWFVSLNNQPRLLQLLLEGHADISAADRRRAREAAELRGFNDIVRLLHD